MLEQDRALVGILGKTTTTSRLYQVETTVLLIPGDKPLEYEREYER